MGLLRISVKSDDVTGRVKTYESIVKGENIPPAGTPESFKVLFKELQALGLDVQLRDRNGNEVELKQDIDDGTEIQPIDESAFSEVNDFDASSEGFSVEDPEENGEEADSESDMDGLFTESAESADDYDD